MANAYTRHDIQCKPMHMHQHTQAQAHKRMPDETTHTSTCTQAHAHAHMRACDLPSPYCFCLCVSGLAPCLLVVQWPRLLSMAISTELPVRLRKGINSKVLILKC